MTKKFFAILLALVLAFAMSAVAFATPDVEDPNTPPATSTAPSATFADVSITKQYDTGNNTSETVPDEALTFTVVADPSNVDSTAVIRVSKAVGGNIVISSPTYTQVGDYKYTVTENAGSTPGVTYDAPSFVVEVLVIYDETTTDQTDIKVSTVVVSLASDSNTKIQSITNTYDTTTGKVTITKVVDGKFGDKTKDFEATVYVISDVPMSAPFDGFNAWTQNTTTGKYESTKTVTLNHNTPVVLTGMPAGITVKVVESDYSSDGYVTTYSENANTGVTVTEDTQLTVTNFKDGNINTGVTMDSMPYIVLLALAVVGLAAVTMKKRYEA